MRSQSDPEIYGVCEDSRKTRPGDLFIARTGTKTNGTQFIDDAFAKGAVAAVLQHDIGLPCAVAWARVANVNLACALLAHEVAGNPTAGMKMIGITGTKGKTTVAYLLRSVLKAAGHKVGMIGTVEIDDGNATTPADMTTPGSVELVELFKKMRANGATHCVMEVSSHALHQHRVAGIDFAVAIFTNLTGDHLDYHKTMEEYAAAKAMLFEGLKENSFAVINWDDEWSKYFARRSNGQPLVFTLNDDENAAIGGRILSMSSQSMQIAVGGFDSVRISEFESQILETPLVGRHNAYNLLAVIAAAWALEVPSKEIMHTLAQEKGAPGRLQRVSVESDFHVFVDYAHTHDALENVLSALRTTMTTSPQSKIENGGGQKSKISLICLFGCGGDRDRTKRPKMAAIAERLADKVIVTTDNPRTENPAAIIEEICAGFSPHWKSENKITVEPDRRAAIRAAIAMAQPGDVVLLAGKGHENYQIIGTTKHHFDDVEEAQNALQELNTPGHESIRK
jgi:UDP-N-acetylmuramoyl-L-alanyl-D-glutamate--2,6-diaminopimelate ligase